MNSCFRSSEALVGSSQATLVEAELLQKNRGIVGASVVKTVALLTNELQASTPDGAHLIQKNVELVGLEKQIIDTIDDDTYEEELEAVEEYGQKVSCAMSRARTRQQMRVTPDKCDVILNHVPIKCPPDALTIVCCQKTSQDKSGTHMLKYRYLPWTHGKTQYRARDMASGPLK
ncbi:hypothetical protein HPB50_006293 [Hyalomma asiaticum]|uniref:Uncharacterized protein n=1 Tax=Hyalomma asiaticum TaxID=266040 RepID=A0ACB7SFC5_HYAAI|nr:hypothetical protein HPB50_006293 [Hyalomma asiaticum]